MSGDLGVGILDADDSAGVFETWEGIYQRLRVFFVHGLRRITP
jgi:hypothetical protein